MFALGQFLFRLLIKPVTPEVESVVVINSNNKRGRGTSMEIEEMPIRNKSKQEEVTEISETLPILEESTQESSPLDEKVEVVESKSNGINPMTLPNLSECYSNGTLVGETKLNLFKVNEKLNSKVAIWRGDITTLATDVIVNAANNRGLGGGGVDGAIHSAAGEGLYDECLLLNGIETGESKITAGHDLPAKHIIHTVGPIFRSQSKSASERLLRSCYETTLDLAVANKCKTIAFSGISTGVYGYPLDAATRVALETTRKFLESSKGKKIDKVIFTVFRKIDVDSYNSIISEYFPVELVDSEQEVEIIEEGEVEEKDYVSSDVVSEEKELELKE